MPVFDALSVFNAIEACVWFGYGAALWAASLGRPRGWRIGRVAGTAFALFGASDVVELYTRAWFRPWWLLAWKAACVVVLAGCYLRYRRMLRNEG